MQRLVGKDIVLRQSKRTKEWRRQVEGLQSAEVGRRVAGQSVRPRQDPGLGVQRVTPELGLLELGHVGPRPARAATTLEGKVRATSPRASTKWWCPIRFDVSVKFMDFVVIDFARKCARGSGRALDA